MLDASYYKPKYKTAEARVLYLVARKGYGSLSALAKDLGFTKAFITAILKDGIHPKYAGYLGRKFVFPPALLCFDKYLSLRNKETKYTTLLEHTKFFNTEDKAYILRGEFIKDGSKFQRLMDREIRK